MYDYALKVLREAKERLEESFKSKNYSSMGDAIVERGYICDIEDALDTLESISEDSDEDSKPELDDFVRH